MQTTPPPPEETEISIEKLEQNLTQLYDANAEIIQRITTKANSGEELSTFEYIIEPEKQAQSRRHPHKFQVREVQHKRSVKAIVDSWEVPEDAAAHLQDPDPDETLYGKHKDIMDCSCQNFGDLVRINGQIVVARKYTSMLRDNISKAFGRKFLRNFEILNRLLRSVEALVVVTSSSLAKKQEVVSSLNESAAAIFATWDNVFSSPDSGIYFANGLKEASMPTADVVNKGTLLESGVHTWKVLCDNVVSSGAYDLGVVSPSHKGHFGRGTPTAWGLRQSGHCIIGGTCDKHDGNYAFKTGDVLTFTLDCNQRTLSVSINDVHKVTIPNIILPVHVAFAGGANARARIL